MSTLAGRETASLPGFLEVAARRHAERGITLFDRRGRSSERRTFEQVLQAAHVAAGRWAALGVLPGDRVLTCLPTSWDLADAWLGAVLHGALPVILAPGSALGSSDTHLRHVDEALALLSPKVLLAGESLVSDLAARGVERSLLLTPALFKATAPASHATGPVPASSDPAFLQLTSGSTGQKRAVVISHGAILHNLAASDDAIGAPGGGPVSGWAQTMASWLPLHHDMGLVGTFLFSIACGFDLQLMPPDAFLARPETWLRELAASPTSITAAPSFALGLCAERLATERLDGLDLSGWRAAMIGAEMISASGARAFLDRFASLGVDASTLRACYGLAEATLAVTCDRKGAGIRTRPLPPGSGGGLSGAAEVASTGEPVLDTRVRIAGPDSREVPDGRIGEVQVRGPGLFSGYHGESTCLALKHGWLATGDLGFMHEGELYLTGRLKEILVVRGENLMPQEIEWIAEAAGGAGGACRAGAFSVMRGDEGEQVVVVLESEQRDPAKMAEIERAVRERIGRELALPLADVLVVKRGALPRTTSGKIRRNALRQSYLDGLRPDGTPTES